MVVEDLGVACAPVTELVEVRCAAVPIRDAVEGGVGDEPVAGGLRALEEERLPLRATAERGEFGVGDGLEELEFLRETDHGPGEAAGPGGEAGEALLGVRAAEASVVAVEHGLVGRAAALGGDVVAVAALAVIDGVFRRGLDVLQAAVEKGVRGVIFAHEAVAELVRDHQDADRADGIDEERVRAVEGVDVASFAKATEARAASIVSAVVDT